ncbi:MULTISPECIES: RNA polymerase sigma factor [Sphingobacterium]|uniref:DNA-directed RNA polymerase sigma-70 factor n=1 Tax=Sphingobacterium cellulitidis TaxID=1768011 RepID=A0A8H9KX45_9SPHI|nr:MULTISPECIES: RNA polymerase sigma factor [Sphingobacterium]MBA8988404.1 RNA polymerase sigma-70 factor (ECF subfamily) [Sphingobacterium soli]WFB62749.1 RNA polymerase sigma factor [Sphingobacterium sp. WM]GGE33061.1 DNA-directed RNA polymerase sigma-70 factor [Sphingobacterium soli]
MMNQETFKNTVFVLKDKLYRFANRFLEESDDAYDLVQEVMLKLWEQRGQLTQLNSIEAFAMQMVRNMAYNKIDKLGRQAKYLQQLPGDIQQEQYPSLTKELILKMIDQLPEKQRLVMYLRDIEEYEIVDIAEVAGLEENAVRVNLSRARTTVRLNLTKVFDYEKRRIG